ncbi:MAG: hypothetical protein R3263_05285, partial [Myxococcota bacterium]|nr:hypothetical protein [Myxococcota bacterium]
MALRDRLLRRPGHGVLLLLALLPGPAGCAGAPDPDVADACPAGTAPRREGLRTWCATPAGVWEGPAWDRDPEGRLRTYATGVDGRTEGPFWTFRPDGSPASEAWFAAGELTGPYRA